MFRRVPRHKSRSEATASIAERLRDRSERRDLVSEPRREARPNQRSIVTSLRQIFSVRDSLDGLPSCGTAVRLAACLSSADETATHLLQVVASACRQQCFSSRIDRRQIGQARASFDRDHAVCKPFGTCRPALSDLSTGVIRRIVRQAPGLGVEISWQKRC